MWLSATSASLTIHNDAMSVDTQTPQSKCLMNLPTQETADIQRPFVTKETLAQRYGVCERTIEKWIQAGLLIFLKVNRVVRFHVQGCDEALRRRGFLT